MGILEQIAEVEAEMARTQKNKATEYRSWHCMGCAHLARQQVQG